MGKNYPKNGFKKSIFDTQSAAPAQKYKSYGTRSYGPVARRQMRALLASAAIEVNSKEQGAAVSGRWWKEKQQSRHTASIVKTGTSGKGKKSRYTARKRMEQQVKDAVEFGKEVQAAQDGLKEEQRAKRERKAKMKAENERKSEIVQEVTNTAKLKKMSRKQLRQYEKR